MGTLIPWNTRTEAGQPLSQASTSVELEPESLWSLSVITAQKFVSEVLVIGWFLEVQSNFHTVIYRGKFLGTLHSFIVRFYFLADFNIFTINYSLSL